MNEKIQGTESDNRENIERVAFLAYILFFIPALFPSRHSSFVRFHMRQGLIMLLVVGLLKLLVIGLPTIFAFLDPIILPTWIILFMLGTLHALHGDFEPLPVVGNMFCCAR